MIASTERSGAGGLVATTAMVAVLVGACGGDSAESFGTPGSEAVPAGSPAQGSSNVSGSVSVETTVPVSTEQIATTDAVTPSAPSSVVEITPTTLIPPAALGTDPAAPANNREILPEHQPIIDAYLAGEHASLYTYSQWPLNAASPTLLAAPVSATWIETAVQPGFEDRTPLNQVLDIGGGVTFRPYVAEVDFESDPPIARVLDCQVSAVFWKDVDTGEQAPPDYWPNAGPPGVEVGYEMHLVFVDGRWLLDRDGGREPSACE